MPGMFARFVGAYPIGDVGLAQFLIGILGLVWAPIVAYRGWLSARQHRPPPPPRMDGTAPAVPAAATVPAPAVVMGDDTSSGVILPCYMVWLVLACVVQMLQSVANMTVQRLAPVSSYGLPTIANAGIWASQRIPLEGLVFFLMHHSAGWHAARNSLIMATTAAFATFGLFVPAFANSKVWGSYVVAGFNIFLVAMYAVLWLAPSSWVYRRPALLPLSAYNVVLRVMQGAAYILQAQEVDESSLLLFIARVFQHMFMLPMLYLTMVMDTQFWQGRHPVKQQWYAQLIAPLEGIRFTLGSAAGLIHRIDQLTSSSEIQQLNFAELSLHVTQMLGAGGQARVYHGSFRGRPVAIKMLLCLELTPDIIEDFCTEAQMLNALRHPNIVTTFGVCIVPPTVAIVMELCDRGSLYDALRSADADALSLRDRVRMCRDCAAGVAFLHEQGILHCDLKSHNFLLTKAWVVKLADLGAAERADTTQSPHFSSSTLVQGFARTSSQVIRGTAVWSAPEVLNGGKRTAAGDVYSLGLVFWEILSGRVPFEQLRAQHELLEAVCGVGAWLEAVPPSQRARLGRLEGCRPPMPLNVPPPVAQLLDSCWMRRTVDRPNAQRLLLDLESILVQLGSAADQPYRVAWSSDVEAVFAGLDKSVGLFHSKTVPQASENVQIVNPLLTV